MDGYLGQIETRLDAMKKQLDEIAALLSEPLVRYREELAADAEVARTVDEEAAEDTRKVDKKAAKVKEKAG